MSQRARRSFHSILAGRARTGLSTEQTDLVALWSSDPWELMTGVYQGQPIYVTRDEAEPDPAHKVKPFPSEWKYLRKVVNEVRSCGSDREETSLAIWKSRRTYISYIVCGVALWECLFIPASNWIISKVRQEDASRLMLDKVWFTYKKFPEWFRQSHPINFTKNLYTFEKTDAFMEAAAQNFHETSARGQGGNVFIDEACFCECLKEAYEASEPMAQRIVMASTPGVSGTNTASNEFFRALCEGEEVLEEPSGPVIPSDGGLTA